MSLRQHRRQSLLVGLLLLLPTLSGALPTRTGGLVQWNGSKQNQASTTITVPTDATLLACQVGGYKNTAGFFSNGSMSIAGQPLTLIAGDTSTAYWQGVLAYRAMPPTGMQTLSVDWQGSGQSTNRWAVRCAFYAGTLAPAPVRSTTCTQQGGNPHATGMLPAESGDRAVVFVFQFVNNVEGSFSWQGATEVSEFPRVEYGDMALAEATPTSALSLSASGSPGSDGGICALVLAGGSAPPPPATAPLLVEWDYDWCGDQFQLERCTMSGSTPCSSMTPVGTVAMAERDWIDATTLDGADYRYRVGIQWNNGVHVYSDIKCTTDFP